MIRNPRHHLGPNLAQLLLVIVVGAYVIALVAFLGLLVVPSGYGTGPLPVPLPGGP